MIQLWSYLKQHNSEDRYYSLKECEKMSKMRIRARVIRCLLIKILDFEVFQMCWPSAFIAVFDMHYLQVQVGSKTFLEQSGTFVRIFHNYQIYFDKIALFLRNIND